jgi:hypothetical protein
MGEAKQIQREQMIRIFTKVGKEMRSAVHIFGFLFLNSINKSSVLLYCYPTTFPHGPRRSLGICPIVERASLFPVNRCPCPVLLTIVFTPGDHPLSLLTATIFLRGVEADNSRSTLDQS